MDNFTLGFIGGGRIVQALLDGFHEAGCLEKLNAWVSCPSAESDQSSLSRFNKSIQRTTSNKTVCQNCDIILLAVKPKLSKSVCHEIAANVEQDRLAKILFVSVVPGLTIATLNQWLQMKSNSIRIMYNVNVAKCTGSYALSSPTKFPSEIYLQSVLNQVAYFAGYVTETEIDIMCALIGSGPAFFCTAVEGLADGAVKAGLSRQLANTLAARTMLGCAELLVNTSKHPAVLQNDISTPGGTTIHGLHELENRAVRGAYMNALMAAFHRAQAMAEELATEKK